MIFYKLTHSSGSDAIEDFFIPETKEYFFDRNRSAFEPILYYYQSDGLICLPSNVNPDVFVEELRFYKIDETVIKRLVSPIEKSTSSVDLEKFKYPLQRKLWQVCEKLAGKWQMILLIHNPHGRQSLVVLIYFQ